MDSKFWNERYGQHKILYGDQPNEFFKQQLDKLPKGKILLPADGEGRNAIYAARSGWEVDAFDFSEVAKDKALATAKKLLLDVNYFVADIGKIVLKDNHYDVIGLIYMHIDPAIREVFLIQCIKALKPGGTIIFEAFNKAQLNNTSGGPKDEAYLYSTDYLKKVFADLSIELCLDFHGHLNEGPFHSGVADVVRFVGKKTK